MSTISPKLLQKESRALEAWFVRDARPLPWRQTNDPYAIWVSEVMLQQTQVATVIPYYETFLTRWPTVEALARSREQSVLSEWSGLGYYSRARNLRRGAQHIVKSHAGHFPKDRPSLLNTPGIGPYTAGAILSIAYNLHEPLVDGNVQRVFARYFGEKKAINSPSVIKKFWELADAWVKAAKTPKHFNQALMELGATVCLKNEPKCPRCPLKKTCYAFKHELQTQLPKKTPPKKRVDLWWLGIVFKHNDLFFLKQNGKDGWWADLWNFPHVEVGGQKEIEPSLSQIISQNPHVKRWERLALQKHSVTHHRIHFVPYLAHLSTKRIPKSFTGKWWDLKTLKSGATSSLVNKVVSSLA